MLLEAMIGERRQLVEEEEEEQQQQQQQLRSRLGAGVNKVYVRRTSVAIAQGSGIGCNTTSPFVGSRHYVSNQNFLPGKPGGGGRGSCVGFMSFNCDFVGL